MEDKPDLWSINGVDDESPKTGKTVEGASLGTTQKMTS